MASIPGWPRAPSKPKQLKVLEALDHAKTQYYHVCAIWIAGMGFFTDSYDLFCISVVARLLGRIYYSDPISRTPGVLPINVYSAVTATALCGTLTGHIFFGWLGDKLGRKTVYGITLIMMAFFSIASGLSFGHSATAVMATLCFFRFWLGFGIGGDYPLSATIMSEYANTTTRGTFIAAVFAMQGFGILSAGAVGVILACLFNKAYPAPGSWDQVRQSSTVAEADYLWRIMFMLGAVPAVATYYYRMRMPETARYTALVLGNTQKAAEDMTKVLNVSESSLRDNTAVVNVLCSPDENETSNKSDENSYGLFSREFVRRHGKQLLGTATSWFLLDIVYYSQILYQSQIFDYIGWTPKSPTMNAIYEVYTISRAQSLLALCGVVPGYWVTVALVDRIGRKVIQLQGFLFMSIFLFVIAFWYGRVFEQKGLNVVTLLVFYGLTFFFTNFGPNSTTFIIPAEMFPARLRATCHGISAACGKTGAIVGSMGFLYASQSQISYERNPGYPAGIGLRYTLIILASISILGALCTFLVPETKNRSLEEISEERDFSSDFEFSEHPRLHQKLRQQSDTMI